jgi:EAL domain-containing protein (putative c-di-GMP-specific phosphodiesterase class I)
LPQQVASRLQECIRESDFIARLGGDEFAVILSPIEDIANIERVATSILLKLAEPFKLHNVESHSEVVYISASMGITLYPDDASDLETLLKNADQAMYTAKYAGRNRYQFFTESMQKSAKQRMRISNDMHGALAANQYRIYYQPVIELATGNIHKAEALIRWQHPKLGVLCPADFIPVAEENGLILEIGDWMLRESALQAVRWRLIDPAFQISVNKSPVQFNERKKHADWFVQLKELGIPGQCLSVEITEGLLANDKINEKLLQFRDAGIEVALDDFGTGYSSLSYLKKFHIDYLKIDQAFIKHLSPDSNDMALCEAIIVMAHKLNIRVIAEGIETEQQRELLTRGGCDFGQGFLFSKPLLADEFEQLLKKVNNH